MVSVCRGGPGCPPFLSFLLRGFAPARRGEEDCGVSAPHDEVLLFRQKDPKPLAPGRGPQRGCLCPGPGGVGCGTRCAQTVLAAKRMDGTGAQPRPEAPGGVSCHPRLDRASSLLSSPTTLSVIPGPDRGSRVVGVSSFAIITTLDLCFRRNGKPGNPVSFAFVFVRQENHHEFLLKA